MSSQWSFEVDIFDQFATYPPTHDNRTVFGCQGSAAVMEQQLRSRPHKYHASVPPMDTCIPVCSPRTDEQIELKRQVQCNHGSDLA